MLAGLLLAKSVDEVRLAERKGLDLLVVVVPQALLEYGRTVECQEAGIFE